MRLTLLGTGAAAGWPNPWCGCASCRWARGHEVRGQTAVLVGDELLIDCGPDVPRSAARLGIDLGPVRYLLLGHAHPDHISPPALMWRWWSTVAGEELTVVGPPTAIAACRRFLADHAGAVAPGPPPAPVRFVEVTAGDVVAVGGYEVRALAARHGDASAGPAVLYDITGPDGARLLYASDTAAPLPEETTAAVSGRAYHAVLLEETFGDAADVGDHLGLDDFALVVADLRRRGAVDGTSTRVVAVHLGHGNPPGPALRRRLGYAGAEALPDGAVLDIGPGSTGAALEWMPPRVLVTGGARSGKSAEAERRLTAQPAVVYVATAGPVPPDDPEWADRVRTHRQRRPPGWVTLETTDIAALLRSPGPPLLVDSLTMWVVAQSDPPDRLGPALDELIAAWRDTRRPVVAVTDEVGSGIVPATAAGRTFRDALGRVNAAVAAESDEVWLVTAGIPTRLR